MPQCVNTLDFIFYVQTSNGFVSANDFTLSFSWEKAASSWTANMAVLCCSGLISFHSFHPRIWRANIITRWSTSVSIHSGPQVSYTDTVGIFSQIHLTTFERKGSHDCILPLPNQMETQASSFLVECQEACDYFNQSIQSFN